MRVGALHGVQPHRARRRRRHQVDCRPSQPRQPTGETMSRRSKGMVTGTCDWMFALTLAAGVSVAGQGTAAAQAAAQAQAPSDAAQRRTGDSPAATPPPPSAADEAQAKPPTPPQTEDAPAPGSEDA